MAQIAVMNSMSGQIIQGDFAGDAADRLFMNNLDPGYLRPFYDPATNQSYISVQEGYNPDGTPKYVTKVHNAPASLTYDAWKQLDAAVETAAQPEYNVVADLEANGLTRNIRGGLGTMMVGTQNRTTAGNATLSMSGQREAKRDRPETTIQWTPVPIAHADFSFDLREILASRQGGMPLDTTMLRDETVQVVKLLDSLHLGTYGSYVVEGMPIYGLLNNPYRFTQAMTLPTAPGWTPDVAYNELMTAIDTLATVYNYGPFGIYYSPQWFKYLMKRFSSVYDAGTLMSQLNAVGQLTNRIKFMKQVDVMTGFRMVLFSLNTNTIVTATAMRLSVFSWETHAGWIKNYKVAAARVPVMRRDSNDVTGVMDLAAA